MKRMKLAMNFVALLAFHAEVIMQSDPKNSHFASASWS